ncbi:hypothetical protein D3C87_407110 [compost metagenome]
MSQNCKNCTTSLEGKYCHSCGQSADTHKLNFHYMWHDIQHGLLHFDKGIFFTTRELFTRPGHSIREFLAGKRVKHFKPLSMVIVLATIYAFLLHILHIDLAANISVRNGTEVSEKAVGAFNISEWIVSHYAISRLFSIPLLALATLTCFAKQGYNFVEYLVLSAFITGQGLVFLILTLPLYYYLSDTMWYMLLSSVLQLTLFLWTYLQFFDKLNGFRAFIQTLAALLLYIVLIGIFGLVAVLITGFFMFS